MKEQNRIKPWEFYYGVIQAFKKRKLSFRDFHEWRGDKDKDYQLGDVYEYRDEPFSFTIKLLQKETDKETVSFEYFNAGEPVKIVSYSYKPRKRRNKRNASKLQKD